MKYFVVVLLLAVSACSAEKGPVIIGDSFKTFVEVSCGAANYSQEQYDTIFVHMPDADRLPILEDVQKERARCAALKPILQSLVQTNTESGEGQFLPSSQYHFDFSIGANDVRKVGFFSEKETCDEARKVLINMGLKAEACIE